ncbi:uncharacterized protein LOC112127710 [Cimex lectularius]|uniref:Uncharacterized protein n=1 Tax=Cimex lectularius TaxID=79782 RepID=A0A8I6SKB7_CIMLE|nr:uncharacterized protein LOC112127710 [Cimex lectularius]
MFRFLSIILFVYSVSCDQVVINDAVDQLLESARVLVKAKGRDKIKLPSIDKTFEKVVFKTVKIKGEFHASGGVFEDTTSLVRKGDVTMKTEGNKLTLGASLGFNRINVDYSHYSFKLLALHSEGSIHASCAKNAATVVLSIVHSGPNCTVELQRAQIDSLGSFDVKMTGPGDINKLGTVLFTWVLNQFDQLITTVINLQLEQTLSEALRKVDLCEKIPF